MYKRKTWLSDTCEIVLSKCVYGGAKVTVIDLLTEDVLVTSYEWGYERKAERDAEFLARLARADAA